MARAVVLRDDNGEYSVEVQDGVVSVNAGDPIQVAIEADGVVRVGSERRAAWVRADGDRRWVYFDGQVYVFDAARPGARRRAGGHHGTLSAPMPATVIRVQVAEGDRVRRGDTVLVLEAMKMELPVRAPYDGTIAAVHCKPGELVQPGIVLMEIDET